MVSSHLSTMQVKQKILPIFQALYKNGNGKQQFFFHLRFSKLTSISTVSNNKNFSKQRCCPTNVGWLEHDQDKTQVIILFPPISYNFLLTATL